MSDAAPAARRLGAIEAGMAIGNAAWPLNMVTVLRLRVAPGDDAVRGALDELQRRHPPLRARIEVHRRRHRFVYDVAGEIPLHTAERSDDRTWVGAVEAHLNTAMPENGPLAAMTFVRSDGDQRCELVLAFQHAIVDGVSAAALWGELLALLATGPGADPAPITAVPRTVSELTPDRYRGRRLVGPALRVAVRSAAAEARYRWSTFRRAPKVDREARSQVHTHVFEEPTTRRLTRVARDHHCTVHGVLHAAALRAVHQTRYGEGRLRMRTIAFTDLRPRLHPPPAGHDLAPYIALTQQDVAVSGDDDLWAVARAVQEELRKATKGPAKFVSHAMTRPLMRLATSTARLRLGTTAVSHTGPIEIAGSDGPYPVEHVHAFVSNSAIGPEISMRTGTYRGRLTLDAMTLDTDMTRDEMVALVDRIAAQLDAAATG